MNLLYRVGMSKEKMQIIDDLVTKENLCVLATVDDNAPHTSLMIFFADHAVMKFYFLTKSTSKKNKNLKKNPHVSIHIDRREERMSLAINGYCSPIKKQQTIEAIKKLYLMKHPEMRAFASDPDTELIRIVGTSAELSYGYDDIFTTKLKNS